jgi:hypothetical protein
MGSNILKKRARCPEESRTPFQTGIQRAFFYKLVLTKRKEKRMLYAMKRNRRADGAGTRRERFPCGFVKELSFLTPKQSGFGMFIAFSHKFTPHSIRASRQPPFLAL